MKRFEEAYKTKTTDEWCRTLTDANTVGDGLACYRDMETSEQAWANEYIREVTCSNSKKSILTRPAMHSEKMGIPQWKRGPTLDGHAEEVSREYGCMDEQIEEVKKKKRPSSWVYPVILAWVSYPSFRMR